MTKSFDPSLPTDRDRVRHEIGDVDPERMFLDDETIDALLALFSDDLGLTIVNCVLAIAAQLRRPDFKVDWMSVSNQVAAAQSYDQMAEDKAAEWGIGGTTSTYVYAERRDSFWPDADTSEL
jgi:hypothetical protein